MKKLIYVIGLIFACNLAASGGNIPSPTDAQLTNAAERMYKHLSPQLTTQGLTDKQAALRSYRQILRTSANTLRRQNIHPAHATETQANQAFWQPFGNSKYGKAIADRRVIMTKERNPQTLMKFLYRPVTKVNYEN